MHLVDLPDVGTAVVRRLPGSVELGPAVLARTGYGRRPGQPVLLGSDHLPALAATLTGDAGWQAYLDA